MRTIIIQSTICALLMIIIIGPGPVHAGFPTDYRNCNLGCFKHGNFVNCVSDDYKNGFCCDDWDKACMKKYKWCSYGLKLNDYKYLTCPSHACPNHGQPLVIHHSEFDKQRIDEIKWGFAFNGFSFHCRVIVKADPGLNGKLNVQLTSNGNQQVHLIRQPNKFENQYNENGGPWGLMDTVKIHYHIKSGNIDRIPTDWHMIFQYIVNRNIFWGTKSLMVRSWVSQWEESDIQKINNEWQPTSAKYISPEQRERLEKEEQAKKEAMALAELKQYMDEQAKEKQEQEEEIKKLQQEIDQIEKDKKDLQKKQAAQALAEKERLELERIKKVEEEELKKLQIAQEKKKEDEANKQKKLDQKKKAIEKHVADQLRIEKDEQALKIQMEKQQNSIYFSAQDGEFNDWDDPQSIEITAQVTALTTTFGCAIYFCGFCCGGLCLYKMRHRIPVTNVKTPHQLPEDEEFNNIPMDDLYQTNNPDRGEQAQITAHSPEPGMKKKKGKPQDQVVDFYGNANLSSTINNASIRQSDKPLKEGFQYRPFDRNQNQETQYTQHETPTTGFNQQNQNKKFKSIIHDKRNRSPRSPGPFDRKKSMNPQDVQYNEEDESVEAAIREQMNKSKSKRDEDSKQEMSREQWAKDQQKMKSEKQRKTASTAMGMTGGTSKVSKNSKKQGESYDPFGLDELAGSFKMSNTGTAGKKSQNQND